MAEIEYQVDELLYRIAALSGSHTLPEKPANYFTDSDGTYGAGDDGISSAGSEVQNTFLFTVMLVFKTFHIFNYFSSTKCPVSLSSITKQRKDHVLYSNT